MARLRVKQLKDINKEVDRKGVSDCNFLEHILWGEWAALRPQLGRGSACLGLK